MMIRALIATAILFAATAARAQEDLRVLGDEANPRRMLRASLLAQAREHFEARRAAVAAVKTPAALAARQAEMKARMRAALGDLPERTPLNPRVVGRDRRDGYRIEKVIYESRPGHHVTATLYLPETGAPTPGVLMPIGHSIEGKAAEYVQRGAILLARHGLAVLAYDPIGQGERRQLLDGRGKAAISGSTTEHTMAGVGALLVGRDTASYRFWDGVRSLDYLAGRPEIDPKRLGCTGCSGGGTETAYLMALDDRIAVAAPSCYITSLERLFETLGPQDAEQNLTGQVALGLEHAEFLTMRAPSPTLVCAATRDFFDIQGTWTSFREAKRAYGLLGHGERVDLFESDTTHGFPRPQREAVLRWMRRWLLKIDDSPEEADFPIASEADLLCTRSGQVLTEFGGRSVFDLNAERARELAAGRAKARAERGREALLEQVARRIAAGTPVPAAVAREVGVLKREGIGIRKLSFATDPGITVPGLLYFREPKARGPIAVYVDGDGMASAAGPGGPIESLVKSNQDVLAVDLRGFGETAPARDRPGEFGAEAQESFLGLHLARPLLGGRVRDLLAVVGRLVEDGYEEVRVIGVGTAGPVILHAAALDRRIRRVTLERSILSWTDVATTPIGRNQLSNVVPGALREYDLPDLAAALSPRPLTIRQPVDPAGRPESQAHVDEAYASARSAYEREGAGDRLILGSGSPRESSGPTR